MVDWIVFLFLSLLYGILPLLAHYYVKVLVGQAFSLMAIGSLTAGETNDGSNRRTFSGRKRAILFFRRMGVYHPILPGDAAENQLSQVYVRASRRAGKNER